MRLLLTHNLLYVPEHGGANKGNRLLMERLAERGHQCHMVVPSTGVRGYGTRSEFLTALASRGIGPVRSTPRADTFEHRGVTIHAVPHGGHQVQVLRECLQSLEPDCALVSSEDTGQLLLEAALKAETRSKIVYLCRTTANLPFGPDSFMPSAAKTDLLRCVSGIIALSPFSRNYLREHGQMEATEIPLAVMTLGLEPVPVYANFEAEFVTMVNPCQVKGVSIFLELARSHPDLRFLAVRSWGTTEADLASLRSVANIRVVEPVDDIDDIFRQTRVLLVPSLWAELYGRIVQEAMARGIPVLASRVAGLCDSKLGVDYLLPVRPIERYQTRLDDKLLPIAEVPTQDIAPWSVALGQITGDSERYRRLSEESRAAARSHQSRHNSVEPVETYLQELAPRELPVAPMAVSAQADLIDRVRRLSPARQALLLKLQPGLQGVGEQRVIPHRSQTGDPPLSFSQERMWFLDQLAPGLPLYHVDLAWELRGKLDLPSLQASLQEVVSRHEVLRSTFHAVQGRTVQRIHPDLRLDFPFCDVSLLQPCHRELEVARLQQDLIDAPFDLEQGPPGRALLIRQGQEQHRLILCLHHLVTDAWSTRVVERELSCLYTAFRQGRPTPLPALPIQYADYAQWQRAWVESEQFKDKLTFWGRQLTPPLPRGAFPTDYPRPGGGNHVGARQSRTLSPELTNALERLSLSIGATLFMTLVAGFVALWNRYTEQEDILLGTPVANRAVAETEPLVGFFVNTVVLRFRLGEDPTFEELLHHVREVCLGALARQDHPFELVLERVGPDRDLSANPIFQVLFQMNNLPDRLELPGLEVERLSSRPSPGTLDLNVSVRVTAQGASIQFDYASELFQASTISRLLHHYENVLSCLAKDPRAHLKTAPLLSPGERERILVEFNATSAPYPKACLHQLFEEQVRAQGESQALIYQGRTLTYLQLDRRADQLAGRLQQRGVGVETLVGVALERSFDSVVAVLGILKAGAAFVPLDPAEPRERLLALTSAVCPAIVVTARRWSPGTGGPLGLAGLDLPLLFLDEDEPATAAEAPATAAEAPILTSDHLAYVMFTSGSSGVPQGVEATHRNVVNRLAWMWQAFPFAEGEVSCHKTSLLFVDCIWEVFGALLRGVPTLILSDQDAKDPHRLLQALVEHRVSRLVLVPSLLHYLLDAIERDAMALPALKYCSCSGESLPVPLAARCRKLLPQCTLLNLYGSTEVAADVTSYAVRDEVKGHRVPIGRPLSNCQVYVLDSRMQVVPIGVIGQIYVGGEGLARGYHRQPALTRERFVGHPFLPGQLLYRTGDRGRFLEDGTLEYWGRGDRQVKVRGVRVEPGEIERALRCHSAVREAVVCADGSGGLVAYLTAPKPAVPDPGELGRFLRQRLPEAMIPQHFVFLKDFPRTPSGKADLVALHQLKPPPAGGSTRPEAWSPVEARLLDIWREVLGVSGLGIHDNFFHSGGHSLLALQLFARVEERFGRRLPLATLFLAPTVSSQAALLGRGDLCQASLLPLAPVPPVPHRAPLFLVHPLGGGVLVYSQLAQALGRERPVYGLQSRGAFDRPQNRVEEMASSYLQEVLVAHSHGPYIFGGLSLGGAIAFEMARQLRQSRGDLATVLLLDTFGPGYIKADSSRGLRQLFRRGCGTVQRVLFHLEGLVEVGPSRWRDYLYGRLRQESGARPAETTSQATATSQAMREAARFYLGAPYEGPVYLFRARYQPPGAPPDPSSGWSPWARRLQILKVPGIHGEVLVQAPYCLDGLLMRLRAVLGSSGDESI